jgi:deoxyribose-phosphate aldolase
MYIDFAIIDTEINETKAKDILVQLTPFDINSITAPYYLIKTIKNFLSPDNTIVSCFIDYPLGISDIKSRKFLVEQAAKNGATGIDITMPQNLAANRKYDKIREDIKNISEFTKENNLSLRYILEYRVFDHHCLKKICEIFEDNQVSFVYPSSGYFIDNLADNILASIFLYQNSKDLNILCTGNMWTDKHFETMLKSGLYGFRTTSLHSLKNFMAFNFKRQNKNGV